MRTIGFVVLVCAAAGAAFGQSFEIADVHASPHSDNPSLRVFHRDGRYELLGATMVDLVSTAYGVKASAVAGGPSWLESDRFDVVAKAADDASADALHTMLRTLLKERFGLVAHNETRPMPALVLTSGKQIRMKQSEAPGGGGCDDQPSEHTNAFNVALQCRSITMAEFAELLRTSPISQVRAYISNRDVADQTRLKGAWDFDVKWTGAAPAARARAGSDARTLFEAMDQQDGLKLEMGMAPLPVLVVDQVNEKPGPNVSGVSEQLPPLRLEFEVADIRQSTQDAPTAPKFTAGGRMDVRGVALIALIQHAWGLDTFDNDLIEGAPKWLTTERFDILATATPPAGPASLLKDDDSLRLMLRNLMADRFRLALHTEDKPVNVFVLRADKIRMKPADASERSRCAESAAPSTTGSTPQRMIACTNTTPAQFAERLHGMSPQYANRPVVDGTGVDGAYDFSVVFSAIAAVRAAIHSGDGEPGAADPNGAVTLFEALEKQTGMKVVTERRPMPVLVIDHVEQQPTGN